ncbi:hypothetical protein EAI_01485 [Harpegnathos saltator]|uniref:Uncharacterized protein n=1 Tax=Harpegnathos saltator TaxID=610380 RepID=E2BPE0_HARSA|nr:hypothetical protein EAI_01485 [Harpegnathos saltator]
MLGRDTGNDEVVEAEARRILSPVTFGRREMEEQPPRDTEFHVAPCFRRRFTTRGTRLHVNYSSDLGDPLQGYTEEELSG